MTDRVCLQVSDAISDKPQEPGCQHTAGSQLWTSDREVIPALGLAWANCINTRIFLSRLGHVPWPSFLHAARPNPAPEAAAADPDAAQNGLLLRSLQVVFSPHLPQAGAFYVVLQSGVVGVPHPSTWSSYKNPANDSCTFAVAPGHDHGLAMACPDQALLPMQITPGRSSRCNTEHDPAAKRLRAAREADKENHGGHCTSRVATGVFA